MNIKTKYIIIGVLSVLAVGFGGYFMYEWYTLKQAYERSGTVDEITATIQANAAKMGVTADDDYEVDDALQKTTGSTEQSQIAIINNEIFFLNTDDGTYVSDNGDVYDPSTQSLTTTGDNATSTKIDSSQVQLTTNTNGE